MTENIQGTFVSEKISKIRWRHEDFLDAKYFVTGSWDDLVNHISYWTFQKNDEDESVPVRIATSPVEGDVTEIKFLNKQYFVSSSSKGTVKVTRIQDVAGEELKDEIAWEKIHKFKNNEAAMCSALSTFESDIATVGSDGRINLLTADQTNVVRTIEDADSCSLYSVDFLRHSEILTGNIRGHMKIWDLRSDQDKPTTSIMLSEQVKTEASSIAHHPTQKHIVVAGGGDGSLTVWDLRYYSYPISQLSAHTNTVSEILFHKSQPDNLFTCSWSGELWHWNNAQNSKLQMDSTDSHWLHNIGNKAKLQVNSLCATMHKPINSIDIDKTTMLFGCDNEAIYVIQNINI